MKNDITLMNSFLSLKALDADTPEAEEVLAEAQKMLLTMGRVYELLPSVGTFLTESTDSGSGWSRR